MNKNDEYVGIIEYHDAPIDSWMLNNIEIDSLNAFNERCYKASRIAILDLYLDLGMVLRMPFLTFIMMLISNKHKKNACQFELVDDEITRDEVDIVIKSNLIWNSSKWDCDKNLESIENAFRQLADANPIKKKK